MSQDLPKYAPLLVEIGCEEIPAGVVGPGAQALLDALVALLDGAGVAHGPAQWLGTPRRLTAHIADVALVQPDRTEVLTGPPIRAAKTPDGQWSQAALGFAKGQGLELDALYELETPKGPYLAAQKVTLGQPTPALVAGKLAEILRNLPFPKRMRWAARPETFVRPIHWMVALHGDVVLDAEYAGVRTGTQSRGHRFYANQSVPVTADLEAYKSALWAARVMVDPAQRRQVILRGIAQLSAEAGGTWIEDHETLEVVVQLIEWPAPLLGAFDPAFLQIPAAVIRTTLRENQKLFTIAGPGGALLPHYIAVANTLSEESRATVAKGNTRVVSARLSDARFFVEEDTRESLESKLPTLDNRLYLQGLTQNTLGDKRTRILAFVQEFARQVAPGEAGTAVQAANLCKADLGTRMVFEFPELQGVVGGDYARREGLPSAVALAIEEHYQPRFAGDALPQNVAGQLVSLADKLDALASCFWLGLIPTGTQDPYALRRAALGVLRLLGESGLRLSLAHVLQVATVLVAQKPAADPQVLKVSADLLQFCRGRLLSMHQQQFPTDLVEAVLDADLDAVHTILPRLQALGDLRASDGFAPLAAAFKRVSNIVRKQGGELPAGTTVQPALFATPAESRLFAAVQSQTAAVQVATAAGRYAEVLAQLVVLKPAVDTFFDDVMVMADELPVRHNRLALLTQIAHLFAGLADFARIQS